MRIPKIIHVVPRYQITDKPTIQRCERAWESWAWLYNTAGVVPAHIWDIERDSRSIGEPRVLPFVVDVFNKGIGHTIHTDDIIFFTNDDIIIHPMALHEIRRHVMLYEAGTIRRVDINTRPGTKRSHLLPMLCEPPARFMELGIPHCGRDGFVFTVDWYLRHRNDIPDFIIGAPFWDLWFAAYVRLQKGYRHQGINAYYDNMPGCEVADGILIHEMHIGKWEHGTDEDRNRRPANAHNQKLFFKWCNEYWPDMTWEKVRQQRFHLGAINRYRKLAEYVGYSTNELALNLQETYELK